MDEHAEPFKHKPQKMFIQVFKTWEHGHKTPTYQRIFWSKQ